MHADAGRNEGNAFDERAMRVLCEFDPTKRDSDFLRTIAHHAARNALESRLLYFIITGAMIAQLCETLDKLLFRIATANRTDR